MNKFWKASIHVLFSVFAAAAALLLPNLFSAPKPLSANDLHLAWLLSPGRYFVYDASAPGGERSLRTNPELSRLGNGTDTFNRLKAPGVFRVFCVGGSTTRGWPFHEKLSYPSLLSLYLKEALPSRKIEVINAGFLASDSFSDLSLVRELLDYQPDLLLVYEGRNDAWNHSLRSGRLEWLLRAHIFLSRNLRAYGLLKAGVFPDKEGFNHAGQIRKLAYATQGDFRVFKSAFKNKLKEISQAAASGKSGIIFINQVAFPDGTPMEKDVSLSNDWLGEFASEEGAALVDLNGVFRGYKRTRGLIIPPPIVHPDVEGYCLMAGTVLENLKKRGAVAPANEWRPVPGAAAAGCLKISASYGLEIKESYGRVADFFEKARNPGAAAYYRSRAGRIERRGN